MVANAQAGAQVQVADGGAGTVIQRWYVLIVMVLVYTLSIADRYVISTVLEPIRLELQLTDSGIAFLTGVSLALVLRRAGFSDLVADRPRQPTQHHRVVPDRLVGHDRFLRLSRTYWPVAAVAHRRRHRRGRGYAGRELDHFRLFSGRRAVPWR